MAIGFLANLDALDYIPASAKIRNLMYRIIRRAVKERHRVRRTQATRQSAARDQIQPRLFLIANPV